jgi:hypothetical protein
MTFLFTVFHWLTIGAIVFGGWALVVLVWKRKEGLSPWDSLQKWREEREARSRRRLFPLIGGDEERDRENEELRKQGLKKVTIVSRPESPDGGWMHMRMTRIVKLDEWEKIKAGSGEGV